MNELKDLLFKKWELPPKKLMLYNFVTGILYGGFLAGIVVPNTYGSPYSKLILLVCILPILIIWIPNKRWADMFKGKEGGYPRLRYRQIVSVFMLGFLIPMIVLIYVFTTKILNAAG